ncbi:MAG: methionine biosynthesis protein MetW [Planctomycetota bacterium]|jgi:methionine biosynthesis protein MetW
MAGKRFCMPDPKAAITDELLMQHIERGSRVIDLGCGDGRLLQRLRDEHECSVQGVELDLDELLLAIARGVPVVRTDLDQKLQGIPDNAFDYAVLSQTLQQLRHPTTILTETVRVATRALVVVPNFGHWRIRHQVLWHGRAPVTSELPYEWYNTPNLHFMSMRDFRDLAERLNIEVVQELPIIGRKALERAWLANLRAESLLYLVERKTVTA